MPVPLPPGLLRLGSPLPAALHPEAALLSRCASVLGAALPTGAVLLDGSDDLGPLVPGEHVVLRVLGAYAAVRAPTDSDAALAAGVRAARRAAPAGGREDVLVQRAAPCVHAGRIVLRQVPPGRDEPGRAVPGQAGPGQAGPGQAGPGRGRAAPGAPDVARAVEGEAHDLEGAAEVRELRLHRLGRWERPHRGADAWRTPLPPWGMRLARLVRDVVRVVPATELTWADDGRTCRLLGVRSDA